MTSLLEQRVTELLAERAPQPLLRAQLTLPSGTDIELEPVLHGAQPTPGHDHSEPPAAQGDEPVRWAVPGVWDDQPTPERVVPSVGELVAQLDTLVEQLLTVDPSQLPAGQALGEAEALAGVLHRLRLVQLSRTRDVQVRSLYEHQGYRSLTAWQRAVAPDTPHGESTLARRLAQAPSLAAALSSGQVSFAAAKQVTGSLVKVRAQLDTPSGLIDGQPGEPTLQAVAWHAVELICQDRFGLEPDAVKDPAQAGVLAELEQAAHAIATSTASQHDRVEAALVLLATHIPAGKRLRLAIEDVELQLIPIRLEQQERDAQHKRALRLKANRDGTWDLQATLTPEVGEQLHTALAAEARRDPANPLDTHARAQARAEARAAANDQDPDLPVGWESSADRPVWEQRASQRLGESLAEDAQELVPRSPSKRLHDAFGRLLSRYLERGLGGRSGKVPVQACVTISDRTITNAPGAPPARGASGRPLARSLIRRWWCDAHVTVLLMSSGWTPLGVVHTGRTTSTVETKAARVQFNYRCAGDGCCNGEPNPLTPLVVHHLKIFSKYGRTTLEEAVLCCEVLHADIHLGKKTIRLRDGRLINEDGYLTTPA